MTSKQTTKPIEHSIIQSMTKQELAQYLSNLCERYLEEPLEIDKDHLVNLVPRYKRHNGAEFLNKGFVFGLFKGLVKELTSLIRMPVPYSKRKTNEN